MKKKLLSVLLTVCMLLSVIPMTAITSFAASNSGCVSFTGNEDFTVTVPALDKYEGQLQYSTDNLNYYDVTKGTAINSENNTVYFRGYGNTVITGNYNDGSAWIFAPEIAESTDLKIEASGNIMTLLDYTCPDTVTMGPIAFTSLFSGNKYLTKAPELPAKTLTSSCYQYMFNDCTELTEAPELPATSLYERCYLQMFCGCTSLITAPALPATKLEDNCYYAMFCSCSSLINAPKISATTLAAYCCSNMFAGCTSLVNPPELPATNMSFACYYSMFYNCTSLVKAPELPATTLVQYDYGYMFSGCTSLTEAPALPATTLSEYCYYCMFEGCTSLIDIPELSASTLSYAGYYGMFANCSKLIITDNSNAAGKEWTIPSNVTGDNYSLDYMIYKTGGDYTDKPVPGTTYRITSAPTYAIVNDSVESSKTTNKGYISSFDIIGAANASAAYEGNTVTVNVTPNDGSICAGVVVNDGEKNLEVKAGSVANIYTFVMPKKAVTVSATFIVDFEMLKLEAKESLAKLNRNHDSMYSTWLIKKAVAEIDAIEYDNNIIEEENVKAVNEIMQKTTDKILTRYSFIHSCPFMSFLARVIDFMLEVYNAVYSYVGTVFKK